MLSRTCIAPGYKASASCLSLKLLVEGCDFTLDHLSLLIHLIRSHCVTQELQEPLCSPSSQHSDPFKIFLRT